MAFSTSSAFRRRRGACARSSTVCSRTRGPVDRNCNSVSSIRTPYWGSISELIEVYELARAGKITVDVETFSLDDGPEAYRRLHDGTLKGRAVIVP